MLKKYFLEEMLKTSNQLFNRCPISFHSGNVGPETSTEYVINWKPLPTDPYLKDFY